MITAEERTDIIRQIEQKLGLQFLEESNSGNLCFMNNNDELQDEFKPCFTEADLKNFLKSFSDEENKIPEDALTFWQLVGKGKGK